MGYRTEDQEVLSASMASSSTICTLLVARYAGLLIQCIYSGTPTGTLILEISAANTNVEANIPSDSWTQVSSDAVTAANTTAFRVKEVFFKWIRLRYVATSGTGTLNVYINKKSLS